MKAHGPEIALQYIEQRKQKDLEHKMRMLEIEMESRQLLQQAMDDEHQRQDEQEQADADAFDDEREAYYTSMGYDVTWTD